MLRRASLIIIKAILVYIVTTWTYRSTDHAVIAQQHPLHGYLARAGRAECGCADTALRLVVRVLTVASFVVFVVSLFWRAARPASVSFDFILLAGVTAYVAQLRHTGCACAEDNIALKFPPSVLVAILMAHVVFSTHSAGEKN